MNETLNPLAYTDFYEFTMLDSMVREGIADQPAVFEAFARRLPAGRRFGIVAGQGRLYDLMHEVMKASMYPLIEQLHRLGHISEATADWLYANEWSIDIDAYPEGSTYWPGSPVMQVRGRLGEAVLLETLILSVLNHDSAIASAAARMRLAAGDKPLIEMGSRRVHEDAAVAAARAAYIGGFDLTSNIAAGLRHGVPIAGTAAHAWTLAHGDEYEAFVSQVRSKGAATTLLVDTFDTEQGIRNAVRAAHVGGERGPGAIRIDSGDPTVESHKARQLLDALGAIDTKIVLTGDMDEYIIAGLLADAVPVDKFGVGTRVATGSGHPTAGFVYKLVSIDRGDGPVPVAKKSASKTSTGGRKYPYREAGREFYSMTELEREETIYLELLDGGALGWPQDWTTERARENCADALRGLPAAAQDLTHGPAFMEATPK